MNEQYSKIKEIFQAHQGKDNPVTSSQIAQILGFHEDDTHARTRDLILEAMKSLRLPLAATESGYFVITNRAECDEYVAHLKRRMEGIQERIEVVEEIFSEKEMEKI